MLLFINYQNPTFFRFWYALHFFDIVFHITFEEKSVVKCRPPLNDFSPAVYVFIYFLEKKISLSGLWKEGFLTKALCFHIVSVQDAHIYVRGIKSSFCIMRLCRKKIICPQQHRHDCRVPYEFTQKTVARRFTMKQTTST